jgi:hypothetical protein
MNEGHLCYYNGLYLAYELKKYECFSATYSPNFNMALVGEFNTLETVEYYDLIKSINISVKRKYWLSGWLDRYYAGKYLGNAIYARPGYASNMFDTIDTLLGDNNYMVRCIGIWILRLTTELGIEPPTDIIIKSISLLDDWFYECRIEYMLFYNILLKNFPHILEDSRIKQKLISAIASKHLTDSNKLVRNVCTMILKNKELLYRNSEIEFFKNYYDLSVPERIELLEKYWEIPELRKAVIMLVKVRLKYYIKKGDYTTIEMALKKIFDGKLHKEIGHILYEIVRLKEKSEMAKKILNAFKNKYSKLPKDLEKTLFHNINEPIITIRTHKLKELLLFVKEGVTISYELLNKVKEIGIYERVSEKNLNLALAILGEMGGEPESIAIVEEKRELMEYLKNPLNLDEIKRKDLKILDWKDCCVKIAYIPTEGIISIFAENNIGDIIDTFVFILRLEEIVILKIMVMDLLIEEISKNEELLNRLLVNKEVFAILLKLYLHKGYSLLSKKALTLLEKLSLKRDNWLKSNLIHYFKSNDFNSQKSLNNILYLLTENISTYVKIEILNSIKYALENKLIECNKDAAYTFVDIMMNTDSNQPWTIFKNAVDIIFSCPYIKTDEKLLSSIVEKFMGLADIVEEGRKDHILIYLKKLLEMSGVNIIELDEEVIEKLLEFENRNL